MAISDRRERLPEWLLVAIILSLPLQASKTLFPIQQLEISRLLMGVAFVWVIIRGRERGWPFSKALTLSIGAMLAVLAASFIATRWPDGLLLVLAPTFYTAFAIFVAMVIRDRFALGLVGVAVVVSGALIACLAILLEVAGVYLWREGVLSVLGRANATFGDPNILARFLVIALITLLGLVAFRQKPDRRVDLVIAAVVVVLAAALVLTQSRFAWITLAVILPILVVYFRRQRAVLAYAAIFLAAFVAASAINGTAVGRAGEFAAGVTHSLGGDVSVESRGNLTGPDDVAYTPPRIVLGHDLYERLPIDNVRYYLLEAGVAMWEDNPILGVGVGGFRPNILGPYHGFIPRDRLESPPSLPHTFISQIAAENGVIGIVVVAIFLCVVAAMAIQASRSRNEVFRVSAVVAALSILTIFLSSQVAGGFLVEPYLWLAVGVLAAVQRLARNEAMTGTP